MNKTKSLMLLLVLLCISTAGCINPPRQLDKIQETPKKYIPVRIIIEEQTGDLSNRWLSFESGWYDFFSEKGIDLIEDSTKNIPSEQRTRVLLITNDTQPNIKVLSGSGYYSVSQEVIKYNSVPRGYPEGGKRLYGVTIIYNRQNIIPPNYLVVRNDYYDTPLSLIIDFET